MTDSPSRPAIIDMSPNSNRSAFRFPLPNRRLAFTGERYVSGLDGPIQHEHHHRYLFATRFCLGKDVLDVASGEGYGTALLAQVARSVVGVDVDEPVVAFANETYLSGNASFRCGDAAALPIATASIDVVVSFETIEHLGEQGRFITEVARVLRPGGLFIVSSPNRPVYRQQNEAANPFHVSELDRDGFIDLLRAGFPNVMLCGQRAIDGSAILPEDAPTDQHETFSTRDGLLYIRQPGLGPAHYFIALASTSPLPRPPNSLLHNPAYSTGLRAGLDRLDHARAEAEERLAAVGADHERLLIAGREAQAQAAALDLELAASRDAASALREALRGAEAKHAALLQEAAQREHSALADRSAVLAALRGRLDELEGQLHRRADELAAAQAQLSRVYSSTSWRISRPIRLVGVLRRQPPRALFRKAVQLVYWTATLQLPRRMREWRMVRLMYATGSFDYDYYIGRYADVAGSGLDPALHYLRIGAAEGRDPSPWFATEVYRSRHPDMPLSANPLVDAIRNGRLADGRLQAPLTLPALAGAASGDPLAGHPPAVDLLAGVRAATFRSPAVPAMTVVVDARVAASAVERTLQVLAKCHDELALEVTILVAAEADLSIDGIGRIVAGTGDAFWHFDEAISRSQAMHVALVQPGIDIDASALASCLAAATGRVDVAAVCAARIGAGGTLIDAGLQLDPDGSLRPRGVGLTPHDFRIASVSDVDVFAPGLVVVSRQAWQAVGGFGHAYHDPHYAAADFCLRARAADYRIVCQPFAHVRGPAAAWQQPGPGPDTEHLLRERGDQIERMKRDRKPAVLFVDHFIPTPDRDAGSEFVCWVMRIFLGLGYRVGFLPVMTGDAAASYTDDLRRLGIEVISGPGASPADRFLLDNAAAYQLIILHRAPIAYGHIDDIRRVAPYTRVVFNTVDLHFLREERQAVLNGSAADMERAQETKRIELASIRKADCTIIVSSAEREILSGLVGSALLQFVPLVNAIPGCANPFEMRRDVVFVGGFRHLPNVDAVLHFASHIWPRVHARVPDARFIIVGSDSPDAIRDLADPAMGIEVRGFVPDLGALMDTCRLTVAPLRYGAGMKGKVVTSLAHGVPCVASPIAVEGSGLVAGDDILVEADPTAFADAVIAVHEDRAVWERLSASGVRFAEANFSIARATELLREMLRSLSLPA